MPITSERRAFPRIRANLPIGSTETGNRVGQTVDLSENGLCFVSSEPVSKDAFSVTLKFPDTDLDLVADLEITRRKISEEKKEFVYGGRFAHIEEETQIYIRRNIIQNQIKNILDKTTEDETKNRISDFFMTRVFQYVTELVKMSRVASENNEYDTEIDQRLTKLSNEIVLRGYCLEELLENKIIMDKVKESFRVLTGAWVYKSPAMKRAFEKPRGYPGDYLMLETVYDNQPSAGGIGFYFDKYVLNNPYSVAVRDRKDRLREILKKYIQQSTQETTKIFNIACGSCREIKELPIEIFRKKPVIFTCIDWDEEALEFSRQSVKDFPENIKFNFIKEDILKIIKDNSLINSFEKQNLVYTIGLIDYLPDRILKIFIQFFYSLLQSKGKFVLTHKNKDKTFSPLPPNWFSDWKFIPRNKEEVINLFYNCGIKNFSISTEVDEFNDIFYFTLTKEAVI